MAMPAPMKAGMKNAVAPALVKMGATGGAAIGVKVAIGAFYHQIVDVAPSRALAVGRAPAE